MSVEVMELFDIFAGTFGKEKAQLVVKDIETLISDHKRELATKADIREVKGDILEVKGDIREVKADILEVKGDIREVKGDIREVELKLIKEIEAVKLEVEKAKSSTIKWVVGWVAGLLIAYTGVIITILTLLK